ncbi:MAG: lysylphosphatidylglycerol synthase transmembrane domain-containing protein [Waddliaceae bacterium]
MTNKPFLTVFASVLLAILFYLIAGIWAGWDKVLYAFGSLGFSGFAFVCALSFCCYAFRFLRWHYYLTLLGYHIPIFSNFRIYLAGFALSATPAKSGEGIRSVLLRNHGVKYQESVAVFISERLFDMMTVFLITACGLIQYPSLRPIASVAFGLIIFMMVLIQSEKLLSVIKRLCDRFLPEKFSKPIDFIFEMFTTFRICFSLKTIGLSLIMGFISWGFEVVGLFFIANVIAGGPHFFAILLTLGASLLAGSLTFLPGGIGGTEATMVHLLTTYSLSFADAIAITLAFRLCTLWFATIVGLFSFPYRKLRFSS